MDTLKNSNGMNSENLGTPTAINESAKKSSWKNLLKELIIFAIIAGGVVWPVRVYIAEPYMVDGRSMDPTFATGDYLIVDKLSYKIGTPERNSVIVFRYPGDTNKNFIKRIIGLPLETVIVKNDVVTIINTENPKGFVLDQSYITHQSPSSSEKTLDQDEYFVMGDNRAESFDSRYWGPLQKQYVIGRPVVRLFGIRKIGMFSIPIITKFGILPGNDGK